LRYYHDNQNSNFLPGIAASDPSSEFLAPSSPWAKKPLPHRSEMNYYSNSHAAMKAESYGKITLEVRGANYCKSNSAGAAAQLSDEDTRVFD
jgi:hypothetical protein